MTQLYTIFTERETEKEKVKHLCGQFLTKYIKICCRTFINTQMSSWINTMDKAFNRLPMLGPVIKKQKQNILCISDLNFLSGENI